MAQAYVLDMSFERSRKAWITNRFGRRVVIRGTLKSTKTLTVRSTVGKLVQRVK